MSPRDVIGAWDAIAARPDARSYVHPTGRLSEEAYERSGRDLAAYLAQRLDPAEVVVDFGAGDGRVTLPLLELGYDVVAVDSSPRMLELLDKRRSGIRTIVNRGPGLLEALGAPVDVILCLAVVIHHGYDAGAELVGHLARALRPRGRLLLDVPLFEKPADGAAFNAVTTWSAAGLAAAATAAGLTVERARERTGSYRGEVLGLDLIELQRP